MGWLLRQMVFLVWQTHTLQRNSVGKNSNFWGIMIVLVPFLTVSFISRTSQLLM